MTPRQPAKERVIKQPGEWFTSFTGRMIYPKNPTPDQVCIEDIAHSLAHQCRYAGHAREFYSIAQHSLWVSIQCPDNLKLIGLLHDATEAYCQDIIRPIKRQLVGYKEIEQAWAVAIDDALNLQGMLKDIDPIVRHWDDVLLMTERRDLVNHMGVDWNVPAEPLDQRIGACWLPPKAKTEFLFAYRKMTADGDEHRAYVAT